MITTDTILNLLATNLSQVGLGVALFLTAYLANIILGVWQNVKLDGYDFDYRKILKSVSKFVVLAFGIALLTIVVSLLPMYATYVGIEIEAETIGVIDGLVIVGGFVTATVRYIKDALGKLSTILGNS